MPDGLGEAADVPAVIRALASSGHESTALTFVRDPTGASEADSLTYRELDNRAVGLAGWLQHRFTKGDRILLLYPPGLEFVVAFLGCLYGGLVAVPAPLPDGYKRQAERLLGIASDTDCAGILTENASFDVVSSWAAEAGLGHLECRASDAPELALPQAWTPGSGGPDTLALLQYTSGSTSEPKGVMVSHGNFLHNARVLRGSLGFAADRRFGGWVPLYHDMGLIAQTLPALLFGSSCVLMSPMAFIRRPFSWLQMIDRYDINVSFAPNFAFDLCTRRVTDQQLDELDLSRWEVAVNGAEPIRASTLQEFIDRFSRAGFRAETMRPCYGMAEATVYISGASARPPLVRQVDAASLEKGVMRPAVAENAAHALVSCGRLLDFEARIVDPHTTAVLPDGRVGEIWLRGGSVAQGYWRNERATADIFHAVTADGDGGYLRTGDLGLYQDGELFVTGRMKEVLIVRGRNLYPQDLEYAVRSVRPELESGRGAVFAVGRPGTQRDDEVVVLHEVRGRLAADVPPAITAAVRNCLVREFGVAVAGVVLLRSGGVQRTTSGKIQRVAMRELFLADGLDAVYEDLDSGVRQLRRGGAGEPTMAPVRAAGALAEHEASW